MVSLEEWLENINFVTIEDIEKLEYGDTKKFLCIDKRFYERFYPTHRVPADEFFSENITFEYSHLAHLVGLIQFTEELGYKEFEFHLECVPDFWFPLCGGKLPNFTAFIITVSCVIVLSNKL